MSIVIQRYGHVGEEQRYPLAAWIWGHRLRTGQHWMEYLLEFLNVLAGFEYRLGQGLDGYNDGASYLEGYRRFSRLGLRRFVFYDDREKTKHPFDDYARELLWKRLEGHVSAEGNNDVGECLVLVRHLLRAFSAIEEDRSWYAKSLFPANHNLLFWEALRKGATKFQGEDISLDDVSPNRLDAGVSFSERNFFARGGEIYYLILSAGTEHLPERRAFIAQRLETLLKGHNRHLGRLADIVDQAWYENNGAVISTDSTQNEGGTASLGWIVDPACPLYTYIAEDAATFLRNDLDSLECLDLFAHLIGFHLVQYIYHRAHPNAIMEQHASGKCSEACRPLILVDALEGESNKIIRNVSAALFREHELYQEQKLRTFLQMQVETWTAELAGDPNFSLGLVDQAERIFTIGQERGRNRQAYQRQVERLRTNLTKGESNITAFAREYAEVLSSTVISDFRKNFLGVHRKLAKSVGFVAPRTGSAARFVLGDNLLKTLVFANIPPQGEITFGDFLNRLYERYGIIIGSGEAYQSGLLNRQRINAEYYDRNRAAFLEKMNRAGLVTQYSDATALVKNTQ